MPKLSKRLSVIATLVPKGTRVCDIGTDHGYLAIELIKSGIAKSVIAADIGEKPLKNAEKNIIAAAISGVELRLCDGFAGIEESEIDTIIIAGMGGEVISGIIERGGNKPKTAAKTLILQPTTSPEHLRRFLLQNGYEITKEIPIFENQKTYSIMTVHYSGRAQFPTAGYCFIGNITPDSEDGLFYIKKQQKRCLECVKALENLTEKKEDYLYYKSALRFINETLNNT